MKTIIAITISFVCLLQVTALAIELASPDGKRSINVKVGSDKQIHHVILDSKAGSNSIEVDWAWSPDVAFKWLNSRVVIMYQKGSGNPQANSFIGLCAIFDSQKSKLLFLDYVTVMYVSDDGMMACFIPKIGRSLSMNEYDYKINVLSLNDILAGDALPPLTWKQRLDSKNSGTYDFQKSETTALMSLSPGLIADDESEKIFLLAPPVFLENSQALGLLLGMGKRVDKIDKIGVASFDALSKKVKFATLDGRFLNSVELFNPSFLRKTRKKPFFRIFAFASR